MEKEEVKLFDIENWKDTHNPIIEIKNLCCVRINVEGQDYRLGFDELNNDLTRYKITLDWLPEDNRYRSISLFKHHIFGFSQYLLQLIQKVIDTKTLDAIVRMNGESVIQIDTFKDYGQEFIRLRFGNPFNYRYMQTIKKMTSVRDLIVLAIGLEEIFKNLADNEILHSGDLFKL